MKNLENLKNANTKKIKREVRRANKKFKKALKKSWDKDLNRF